MMDVGLTQGPIFIGGLDRSGKTYMRLMLSAHPNIVFSSRTDLWSDIYKKFGDLGNVDNFERCLQAILQRKHIRNLAIDPERLRLDFGRGPQTYERLFAMIHEQYGQRVGKPRWGDQTELLERFASYILKVYPKAMMIHMMRDPRDRYEALLQKPRRRGGIGGATARWIYSATLAVRNQQAFPDRYKVVRYETMVLHPEETMRDVCNFIGETYFPFMLKMEGEARFLRKRGVDASDPISSEYIGRFRGRLSQTEIAFIQNYTWQYMRLFDYIPEPIRFSLNEKARFYLLHWLANTTRMLGWQILTYHGQ
jgi:hypothetical protein